MARPAGDQHDALGRPATGIDAKTPAAMRTTAHKEWREKEAVRMREMLTLS
jgi:hypothetical protein